jgi:hypothetical protein
MAVLSEKKLDGTGAFNILPDYPLNALHRVLGSNIST